MLATKTNARGTTAGYFYQKVGSTEDAEPGEDMVPGRLTRITYSDGTQPVTMKYKRNGELGLVTDAAGTTEFLGTLPSRSVKVTGGQLGGLLVTRTDRGPDQPETVQATFDGSAIVTNHYEWTDTGLLWKAWQENSVTEGGGPGLRHVWNRDPASGRVDNISSEGFGTGGPEGITRHYGYAADGRVENLWYVGGAASVQGFHYDHDEHGRREKVHPYPLATPPDAQPPGWKYAYNERGEVRQADRFPASQSTALDPVMVTHQRRSYAYDLMGNRQSASQGTSEEELVPTGYSTNILQQYDGITHTRKVEITGQAVAGRQVRLSLDGGTDITVDRNDPAHQTGDPNSFRYLHPVSGTGARWLHVKVTAGTPADVVSVRQGFVYVPPAAESLGYDLDGNLTSDGQWTYLWDAENRLIHAEQEELPVAVGGAISPPPTRKRLKFAYDHKHRRISKKVFEWRFDAADSAWKWFLTKDLRFVYDGWQMIAELDHSFVTTTGLTGSGVSRTFLWGPDLSGSMTGAGGVGGLLSTTYQGVTYQTCSDANGNVTGLVPVNGTGAGTLVARFDYGPFGNRVTNAGPNVELCPFGFSSKYLDSDFGLLDFGRRLYATNLGRWLSMDPAKEIGGVNLYRFVENDALNKWDFLGLTLQWHHLLPQALFDAEFMKRHGLNINIHSMEYGWEIDDHYHTNRGGIHPRGWNGDWKKWIESFEGASRKITKEDICLKLDSMKRQYSQWLRNGIPARSNFALRGGWKRARFSQLNKAKTAGGLTMGLFIVGLMQGEVDGSNAENAETVRNYMEQLIDNPDMPHDQKMVAAIEIALGLEKLFGTNPSWTATAILSMLDQ